MWVLMIEASGASIRGRLARISVSLYVITHHKTFMAVDLMRSDVYSQSAGGCKGWEIRARRKTGLGTDLYTAHIGPPGRKLAQLAPQGLLLLCLYDGIASGPVENGRWCMGTCI